MNIGIIADPTTHADWNEIEALLRPAAALGHAPILSEWEAVWAVYDDGLMAAATARLTNDDHGEIILCGGSDASRWAQALADRICEWFRDEGMTSAMIRGRKGWGRMLKEWTETGCEGRVAVFERTLA